MKVSALLLLLIGAMSPCVVQAQPAGGCTNCVRPAELDQKAASMKRPTSVHRQRDPRDKRGAGCGQE